jgi:hypothetical protein
VAGVNRSDKREAAATPASGDDPVRQVHWPTARPQYHLWPFSRCIRCRRAIVPLELGPKRTRWSRHCQLPAGSAVFRLSKSMGANVIRSCLLLVDMTQRIDGR